MKRMATLVGILLLAGAADAAAQTEIRPPRDYTLTNARIVVAPGRTIERGIVVVRDGRITAVGERVQVPSGGLTLDLEGRTIYPGFVDPAVSHGLPAIAGGGRGGGGRGGAAEQTGPQPELSPARAAADVWAPTETDLNDLRAAGITTAGLAFEGGIFPGRVSVVSVRDSDPARRVLRSPVAQQIEFGRNARGYPGTYIGALAYIEQSFLDAQHDARVEAAFARNPATAPTPSYDSEHRALQPAAAGEMAAWIAASSAREIDRHLDLARLASLANFVLVGVQEGYKVADRLKAAGKPVIVSLDYPAPRQVTGRTFELRVAPVTGEDSVAMQADSAIVKELRGNAARLIAAGVPVALSSRGATPAQFLARVKASVEEGLAADEALRALTETPARLLGIDAAVGTIEVGKLANLLVVQGDLFAKDVRIGQVFVEGERYNIPEPPAGGGRGGGRGGGAGSAGGEWTGEMEGPGGMMSFTLTLEQQGASLTGTLTTEMGPIALQGEQNGNDITLRGTASPPGMNAIEITITASVTGDQIRGTLDAAGMATVPFSARRRPGFAPDGGWR
ncbi:MAG: amidohydrolase family protein [Gemmatimonadetes bacterium]|nr:amidohydrolase family protein [Gemmatimonadota bacterium]